VNLLVIGNSFDVVHALLESDPANNFCVITHDYDIKNFCLNLNIPVFKLSEFERQLTTSEKKWVNFDLGVCSSFEILPKEVFDLPKFGSVNIHPASLPDFGGRYPFPMLIESGQSYSEVCIHKIDARPDSGRVLTRKRYTISPSDYYLDWLATTSKVSTDLILDFLNSDFRTHLAASNSFLEIQQRPLPFESRKPQRELYSDSRLSLYDAIRINSRVGGTKLLNNRGEIITIFVAESLNSETPLCNSYCITEISDQSFFIRSDNQEIVKVTVWKGVISKGDSLFRLAPQE
jgi:methionyl-tRNA formyltransferase